MNPAERARPTNGQIAGVVLAAGAGRRMGGPKADLVVAGRRLVDRAVDLLHGAGCARVVVVGRAGLEVPDAEVAVNPRPERGMRSSLEIGITAAADADAIAVVLVDTPGLTTAGVGAVLDAWRPGRIAVARYGDVRGHPTVMSPTRWQDAVAVAGPDEGARAFLKAHSGLVDEVPAAGRADDLDTRSDLDRWVEGGL